YVRRDRSGAPPARYPERRSGGAEYELDLPSAGRHRGEAEVDRGHHVDARPSRFPGGGRAAHAHDDRRLRLEVDPAWRATEEEDPVAAVRVERRRSAVAAQPGCGAAAGGIAVPRH